MQLTRLLPFGFAITCASLAAPAPEPTALAVLPRIHSNEYINYTTLTGFFLQDDPATSTTGFDYAAVNFGLINRTYSTDSEVPADWTQWQKFDHYVWRLNRGSGRFVQYKVLYMGRHGEGYHNVAETYYGTPAWNCYWSLKDGNGTVSWADARITPNGVAQAVKAHDFWASHITSQKIPVPETYYTSPLTRCLQTANITFSGLDLPSRQPFIPTVKELFREGISGHTCDRRGTKTYIQDAFPAYKIEAGFSEDDLLWKPLQGEVPVDEDIRSKIGLDEVFDSDDSTYISITSHSGEIASLLRVLGHRNFSLSTGQAIPVLVKAETIESKPIVTASQAWTTISTCSTAPPLPTAT
ncbi:phosphoglycerate mutase family protein [Hyaloscypha bicolor E]|uniref:Phosphoglycerate mutase family protein n=1 Tax=Hyaloscypha bicolor E TaxID=1095630 RepID=A0A2J6THF3_9HELO|nr:phosphoglycerate mutase family protein [Hyaloscypha bicolor E]PMD62443.1 phosphoglycerate mutase family protein [Hyaloscypha bicolor E]